MKVSYLNGKKWREESEGNTASRREKFGKKFSLWKSKSS